MMPFSSGAHGCAVERDDGRLDAGQRQRGGARLDRQQPDAVRIAEHRTAGLGLPHVIDHRHAAAEHACSAASPTPAG